ncbi:protein-domain-containing protein [Mycotypha africana]|uniref:protein-domain-containing protein n=1 Tax=Mycotypha africana TaxID=64632 RepID=UPI0023007230|nr:protein-domain-containing protein [Mycotypha africana]KAI8984132.1 protein-domain-containing protein [Mycotypha africana]
MGSRLEFHSKLYELEPVDADDELELDFAKFYANYCEATKNKSEIELHNYLHDKASQNKKEYHDLVSALLYGILTEPADAKSFFQSIAYINRDHFANVVNKLQTICNSSKFHLLKSQAREQLFWLVTALTNLNVNNIDLIYLSLLKQIRGGDFSQPNLSLCDQYVKLCERVKPWLDVNPKIIAMTVYTYLRVLADHHRSAQYHALQQKEIRFVMNLMRERWMLCVPIGRDLIRALYDVQNIPEFKQFWQDLLQKPQSLSSKFKGVDMILNSPTPKEFLRSRLTVDMETKLLYILQNLRINQFQRNLNWFTQRYLSSPESEPFYVDIIRYIVAGWYPSNQILQSDIVPRYVVIGSMLRAIRNNTVAMNVKTALILDWLFFKPTDNIMFIEPAMLLIERSAERYPSITASLIDFLKRSVEEYFPPMKEYMAGCVTCGMRTLLSKGVIRSLLPLYKLPTMDSATKDCMKILFHDFLDESSTSRKQQQLSTPSSSSSAATVAVEPMPTPTVGTTNMTNTPEHHHENRQQLLTDFPLSANSFINDSDVDAYLYGEPQATSTKSTATTMNTGVPTIQGQIGLTIDEGKPKDVDRAGKTVLLNTRATKQKTDSMTCTNVNAIAPLAIVEEEVYNEAIHQEQLQRATSSKSMMMVDDVDMTSKDEDSGEEQMKVSEGKENEGIAGRQFKQAQEMEVSSAEDYEEEDERAQAAMESNQSYWIFGDSLSRFKEACVVLLNGTGEQFEEMYDEQNTIAKKNLSEILAVYYRIAIPAEMLVATIGTHIRNIIASTMLSHTNTAISKNDNEDILVKDSTKDVFDLVMFHYWNMCAVKKDDSNVKKMIELLSCLAHQTRIDQRRHMVGVRWWSFIADQMLKRDEVNAWFPTFLQGYQSFVKHAYSIDHSTMNENEYLKNYLEKDLQMLAQLNVSQFNRVITLLYQFLPDITSGNLELLKLTLMMLLPETMGKMALELHYGYYHIFGNKFTDYQFISTSFTLPTFETLSFWQLLTAELQGRPALIQEFFQNPKVSQLLKVDFKNEIIPFLLTLLKSVAPSKELIHAIVQIVPISNTSITDETGQELSEQLQLTIALLQHWSTLSEEPFISSLSDLVSTLIDQTQIFEDGEEKQLMAPLLTVLYTWWRQRTAPQSFKQNKELLASLFKLGKLIGFVCPKEWNQDIPRKRKRVVVFDSDEDEET